MFSKGKSSGVDTKKRNDRRWQLLIVLPYVVGIAWACLHPIASILTGHFSKPRGWYVDENSLETAYLRSTFQYLGPKSSISQHVNSNNINNNNNSTIRLCESVAILWNNRENVECHRHVYRKYANEKQQAPESSFDLLRLVPTGNTVEPSNEAIALVAPFSSSTTSQDLPAALLELMHRLASPFDSPWLAKTVLLIVPTNADDSLHDVTHAFLEAYAGHYDSTVLDHRVEALPPKFTDAMIRNLIVLDVTGQSSDVAEHPQPSKNEIRILSQGELGVLPNMDLVFVSMNVFSRSSASGNTRRSSSTDTNVPTLIMHPYGLQKRKWETHIKSIVADYGVPPAVEKWAIQMADLGLFCKHLFGGPYAPHALALNRGIDAVTIQGRYLLDSENASAHSFVADFVQKLEITLHGLSNLHERLHHSTTLYLLPSPKTFVKHEEYLVPNLLLLVPAVFRAALLGLRDIQRFNIPVLGWLLCLTVAATIWMDVVVANLETTQRNAWWTVTYAVCAWIFYDKVLGAKKKDNEDCQMPPEALDPRCALQTAQLVVCLLTIYVHVPICFGHVALSYPSAFFWAPWVAIPCFAELHQNKARWLIAGAFLLVSWPPVALLNIVFADVCTPYIRFAYFPLHLLLLLCFVLAIRLSSTGSGNMR